MGVEDRFRRQLRDLRVSVTDRCNFRCTYCMPREAFGADHAFLQREQLLTFEEIATVVRALAPLGVQKVRLTGGEPLLRRDLERLVELIKGVEGISDLAVTTNGALLAEHATRLRGAGLDRVTVSLDALDETTFQTMSDVRLSVQRVLDGIAAADAAGFATIKINAVVQRGVNEHAIADLAAFGRRHGYVVRFIEYMDVGTTNGWCLDQVVPAAEILERIDARWPVEPIPAAHAGEVASRFRYRDGAGEVGVIASVTQPFCGTCTRARLSAVGELYTCLFASRGHDLRAVLRSGGAEPEIAAAVSGIWARRTDRYSQERTAGGDPTSAAEPKVEMSYIGG